MKDVVLQIVNALSWGSYTRCSGVGALSTYVQACLFAPAKAVIRHALAPWMGVGRLRFVLHGTLGLSRSIGPEMRKDSGLERCLGQECLSMLLNTVHLVQVRQVGAFFRHLLVREMQL